MATAAAATRTFIRRDLVSRNFTPEMGPISASEERSNLFLSTRAPILSDVGQLHYTEGAAKLDDLAGASPDRLDALVGAVTEFDRPRMARTEGSGCCSVSLVSRFRSSSDRAAITYANFGIEGH
jgi:hypothetical protein